MSAARLAHYRPRPRYRNRGVASGIILPPWKQCVFAILAALIIAGCDNMTGKPRRELRKPVPKPIAAAPVMPAELAGLHLDTVDKPRNYNEKNLWEYMDGGAHEIIRLGFRGLTVAYYRQPGSTQEVRVEVFTMKSPGASQALFNAWRSKNNDKHGICGHSVYDAPTLLWHNDEYYVQLIASTDNTGAKALLESAGRKLCAVLTLSNRPNHL